MTNKIKSLISAVFLLSAALSSANNMKNQALPFSDVPESEIFNWQENPWGLVYMGAIKENIPGKVNITPVKYMDRGIEIAANVYTPAGYDPTKSYAAIIVVHPGGGVKEQVAGLYAQRMAEEGYVTMAADAAYQGASGGEPHGLDNTGTRVENISGSFDFLSKYPGVDRARIGVIGICAGSGFTLKCVQTDKRFRAVGIVSCFDLGVGMRAAMQGEVMEQKLAEASAAREKYALSGEVEYWPILPEDDPFNDGEKGEIVKYYRLTHFNPRSTNQVVAFSLLSEANFVATQQNMNLINIPIIMFVGSDSYVKFMTDIAYGNLTGTDDKQLVVLDGATHMDTYQTPKYVDSIVGGLTEFFGKKL